MGACAGSVSGDVTQDGEEPRSEWTSCVKTGERRHDPAECLLNEIFSILDGVRELPGDRERSPEITRHQFPVHTLVAGQGSAYQFPLGWCAGSREPSLFSDSTVRWPSSFTSAFGLAPFDGGHAQAGDG